MFNNIDSTEKLVCLYLVDGAHVLDKVRVVKF